VANTTGKPVAIRNPVTDKVLATIRPAKISVEQTVLGHTARLPSMSARETV
jgi:hypothetical protein